MKKKEKITLGVIALLLIVTIVGVSYAAFTFAQSGKNLNTVTTGIMQMSYEESSNIIKMTGALPTTDATGKVRLNKGEYFDFTVSSTIQGDAQINWEIAAEDFSSNTFDGKNIKLYLTTLDSSGKETEVMAPKVFTKKTTENKKTGRPANMMSLATGTMSASTSTKYRLRMWVDENYNPQGDGGGKKFAVRINVYGKVYEEPTGSQMKAYNFGSGSKYKNVVKVVTQNTLTEPSNVTYSEDLSSKRDGSVMAYVGSDNVLTIAGEDSIVAGEYIKFTNLSKVTSIDLTYLDTSKVTNMSEMFYKCGSLTSLDVSNFDTSNVTNMSFMFYSCNSLTSLDVSDLDTSNVTNMYNMFSLCRSLTSLDVSNFDTSKVTDMSNMFNYCEKITTLDVSNFVTSNVTNMSAMFCYCRNITTLDVSNFVTSNVTNMSSMFNHCEKITTLDVSNFDTSKVTAMSAMFLNCDSLTSLDVSNFDTSKVTAMFNMFCYCMSLSSLDVSNFDTSKVTSMAGMFKGCSLTSLDLSNFDTSKVTNMKSMFDGCSSLTSLDLSNFDTSNVTNMSYMFYYCLSLTSLDVSNFDTSKVTDMPSMFYYCTSLSSLNLGSFNTSNVTNMSRMFEGCSKMQIIKVSNKWVIGSGCTTTNMFTKCGVFAVTVV